MLRRLSAVARNRSTVRIATAADSLFFRSSSGSPSPSLGLYQQQQQCRCLTTQVYPREVGLETEDCGGIVPQRYTSYVAINLDMLKENMERIEALGKGAKVLPMVKGNAYGNGLVPIAQFLGMELGYKTLGVASLGEALNILRGVEGFAASGGRVIVFSDTEIGSERHRKLYYDRPLVPVLQSARDLRVFLDDPKFNDSELWLKINTGMNRLGCSQCEVQDEILPLMKQKGHRRPQVDVLLAHFSVADMRTEDNITLQQVDRFNAAKKLLEDNGVSIKETSCSNSGGIVQGLHLGESNRWIRAGLMIYGPSPWMDPVTNKPSWDGKQISALHTKVLEARQFKGGESIGYGVAPLPEDCLVVTMPLGYADGFVKYYTGCTVEINGLKGKVHGHICMDMSFVIFAQDELQKVSPEQWPKVGQEIDLWTHDIATIARLAAEVGTNPHSLMCCLTSRVPRFYIRNGKLVDLLA